MKINENTHKVKNKLQKIWILKINKLFKRNVCSTIKIRKLLKGNKHLKYFSFCFKKCCQSAWGQIIIKFAIYLILTKNITNGDENCFSFASILSIIAHYN